MPIALRETGAAVSGWTSVAPTVPASAAAGDISILTVSTKPYSTTIGTPAGWTKIDEITNGTVAASSFYLGSTKLAVFWKESATAGSTVTVSTASGNSTVAAIDTYSKASGEAWDVTSYTLGGDNSNFSGFNATGSAGINVASGDSVLALAAINAGTSGQTSVAIGGMSGATLSATTTDHNDDSPIGYYEKLLCARVAVTVGTSNVAPQLTYTWAPASSGSVLWLRLRVAITDLTAISDVARAGAVGGPTIVRQGMVAQSDVARATAMGAQCIVDPNLNIRAYTRPGAVRAVGFTATVRQGMIAKGKVGRASAVRGNGSVTLGLPALAPHWQILIRSPEWAAVQQLRRQTTSVRIDIIDEADQVIARFGGANVLSLDGTVVDDGEVPIMRGVAGWSVQADSTAPVRRTCTLSLTDPSFVPRPGAVGDLFHPLGRRRARVWHLTWSGDQWWPVLLGTFHLDAPSIDVEGSMEIGGYDSVGLVKKAKWITPLTLGGMACHTAIQQILAARAPWLKFSIAPTDNVLPNTYEVGAPGDDPWDDVVRIQEAAGLDVYADRAGMVVGEIRDSPRGIVADYSEGELCTLTDLSRGLSLDDFANVVMVESSSSSVEPPVSAVARNDDIASPGWVGYGYDYVHFEKSDAITTVDQATALAKFVLAQKTAFVETLSMTARANPVVDPLDLVTVGLSRAGVAGTFQVQAIAWSSDPLMTVDLAERRRF